MIFFLINPQALKFIILTLRKSTFDKLLFAHLFHYTSFEDPARLARAFDSLCSRDCTPIVVFFHNKSKHTQVQLTNDPSGNYT